MSETENKIVSLVGRLDTLRLAKEKKLASELIKIYEQCRKELYLRFLEMHTDKKTVELEQIESTIRDIEAKMKYYTNLTVEVRQNAIDDSFINGQKIGADILAAGGENIRTTIKIGLIDKTMVEALVGNIPKLAGKVETDVLFRIRDELTRGAIMGESIPKIAKRIFGTGLTTDGLKKAMDLKKRCITIARTEVIKASDAGYEDLASKAESVINEELFDAWITAGDERVEPECRAIANGTDSRFKSIPGYPGVYKRREGPRPVISTHLNCRCRRIPMLLSWLNKGLVKLNDLSGHELEPEKKKTVPKLVPKKDKGVSEQNNPIQNLILGAPVNNRKYLAEHILKKSELSHINVTIEPMQDRGCTSFKVNNGLINVERLALQEKDPRSKYYQIKTAFHEITHAKMHGGATSALNNTEFFKANYRLASEETVAECVAHYMTKEAGITEEIMPSYSNYLINNLPKLKQLPEYKKCSTIADFGKILSKYRYGAVDAELLDLRGSLEKINIDINEYAKQYRQYVMDNLDDIVNKIKENSPDAPFSVIKDYVEDGWHNMKGQGFNDSLILAMNRLGVK